MAGMNAWLLEEKNGNVTFKRKKPVSIDIMEKRKKEFKSKKKKRKIAKKSRNQNR